MSCVCLNQSSNAPVALDVVGVVEVREQLELLGDLVLGLDRDEAVEHELALQDAAAERDDPLVEAQVVVGRAPGRYSWMTASPAWKSIGAPAIVSVLTCSGCSAA